MDIKPAIQRGDATGLRELLAADPARANHLIEWGAQAEIHTHPLHPPGQESNPNGSRMRRSKLIGICSSH